MFSQIVQKFLSRKFLMAVAALATAITGSNLEGSQLFVTGVVAAAYVLAEAFTDRGRADQLAAGVEQGLTLGKNTSPDQLTEDEILRVRAALALTRPSGAPKANQ